MKIVDRKTFLALPAETLFSKYAPCYMEAVEIKGESLGNDYCYQQIADAIDCKDSGEFADKLFAAQELGESIPMDFHCQSRDGCFDAEQLFAVWEPADVEALIARLQQCLNAKTRPTPVKE